MSHKSLFPHNNIQFRLERAKYEFSKCCSQKKEHSQMKNSEYTMQNVAYRGFSFMGVVKNIFSEVIMTLLRKPNIDNSIETTSLLALGHMVEAIQVQQKINS